MSIRRSVMRGERETHVAGRLFDGLELMPLARNEGHEAGRWRRSFSARGVTLSGADCLIAAAALTIGGRLATGNPAHFPMPELDVAHWLIGE